LLEDLNCNRVHPVTFPLNFDGNLLTCLELLKRHDFAVPGKCCLWSKIKLQFLPPANFNVDLLFGGIDLSNTSFVSPRIDSGDLVATTH